MEASNVVTIPSWVKTEDIPRLREAGVSVEGTPDLDDLDLPGPKYGEEIVGSVTAEEAVVLRDLSTASEVAEDLERSAAGKAVEQLGRQIATSDRKKTLQEVLGSDGETPLALDAESAEVMFSAMQRKNHLHAMLHYMMGERLKLHSWRLGVRSKGRIVKIGRRW